MSRDLPEHEVGGGNVFADVGVADAEAHLLKARLVSRLQDLIDERGLSQGQAARLIGVGQPDLSHLLRGHLRGWSVERLLRLLAALGCEVDIVIRRPGEPDTAETIHVHPAAA